MLAPISWLKDYVNITLAPKALGERLTEVGLGTERITKADGDLIFELEITPNRPDLLSVIGVAREIAAIQWGKNLPAGRQVKYPKLKTDLKKATSTKVLPLDIKTNLNINPRFTAIIIDGITVEESPNWLKERLIKINQRPINNIVDITNYVMFELGNPIHAFDYHKISGQIMIVDQAKEGGLFKSVDGISYHLPKNAVIIRDKEKIIDLCGIKGGFNSGTFADTKTIIIRVPVENPVLTRRASQSLGIRTDASSIFEKGVNADGTIDALKRCVDLVLELAGGQIASNLYDLKKASFSPWKLKLRIDRLNKILGITISRRKVLEILESLNLNPVVSTSSLSRRRNPLQEISHGVYPERSRRARDDIITECTIPTYRNDLKIEEDLIEEVARLYGYNNFPKTIPVGEIPTQQIPYFMNYRLDEKIKNIFTSCGFSEIYTYSLISEKDLTDININPEHALRIDNPVSREYEYLRPTLKSNLIKALIQNKPNFDKVNLFELGKVYLGKTIAEAKEQYFLSGISNNKNFYEIKGILEYLYQELGIKENPTSFIEIVNEGIFFEINFSEILEKIKHQKAFVPIPKYPPVVEDLAIVASQGTKTGEIMEEIKKQSPLIVKIDLIDQYENARTFHIIYQHKERNLTSEEVAQIREKILLSLKEKFNARPKE